MHNVIHEDSVDHVLDEIDATWTVFHDLLTDTLLDGGHDESPEGFEALTAVLLEACDAAAIETVLAYHDASMEGMYR